MIQSRKPELLDLVAVLRCPSGLDMQVGDVGTVVALLPPDDLKVACLDCQGRTRWLATLSVADVLPLNRERTPIDEPQRPVWERKSDIMVQLTIEMSEGALAALRQDPATFTRELRLAAAVKWYEMRRISQGKAAEIAGLSRSEFITCLRPVEIEGHHTYFWFSYAAPATVRESVLCRPNFHRAKYI